MEISDHSGLRIQDPFSNLSDQQLHYINHEISKQIRQLIQLIPKFLENRKLQLQTQNQLLKLNQQADKAISASYFYQIQKLTKIISNQNKKISLSVKRLKSVPSETKMKKQKSFLTFNQLSLNYKYKFRLWDLMYHKRLQRSQQNMLTKLDKKIERYRDLIKFQNIPKPSKTKLVQIKRLNLQSIRIQHKYNLEDIDLDIDRKQTLKKLILDKISQTEHSICNIQQQNQDLKIKISELEKQYNLKSFRRQLTIDFQPQIIQTPRYNQFPQTSRSSVFHGNLQRISENKSSFKAKGKRPGTSRFKTSQSDKKIPIEDDKYQVTLPRLQFSNSQQKINQSQSKILLPQSSRICIKKFKKQSTASKLKLKPCAALFQKILHQQNE